MFLRTDGPFKAKRNYFGISMQLRFVIWDHIAHSQNCILRISNTVVFFFYGTVQCFHLILEDKNDDLIILTIYS